MSSSKRQQVNFNVMSEEAKKAKASLWLPFFKERLRLELQEAGKTLKDDVACAIVGGPEVAAFADGSKLGWDHYFMDVQIHDWAENVDISAYLVPSLAPEHPFEKYVMSRDPETQIVHVCEKNMVVFKDVVKSKVRRTKRVGPAPSPFREGEKVKMPAHAPVFSEQKKRMMPQFGSMPKYAFEEMQDEVQSSSDTSISILAAFEHILAPKGNHLSTFDGFKLNPCAEAFAPTGPASSTLNPLAADFKPILPKPLPYVLQIAEYDTLQYYDSAVAAVCTTVPPTRVRGSSEKEAADKTFLESLMSSDSGSAYSEGSSATSVSDSSIVDADKHVDLDFQLLPGQFEAAVESCDFLDLAIEAPFNNTQSILSELNLDVSDVQARKYLKIDSDLVSENDEPSWADRAPVYRTPVRPLVGVAQYEDLFGSQSRVTSISTVRSVLTTSNSDETKTDQTSPISPRSPTMEIPLGKKPKAGSSDDMSMLVRSRFNQWDWLDLAERRAAQTSDNDMHTSTDQAQTQPQYITEHISSPATSDDDNAQMDMTDYAAIDSTPLDFRFQSEEVAELNSMPPATDKENAETELAEDAEDGESHTDSKNHQTIDARVYPLTTRARVPISLVVELNEIFQTTWSEGKPSGERWTCGEDEPEVLSTALEAIKEQHDNVSPELGEMFKDVNAAYSAKLQAGPSDGDTWPADTDFAKVHALAVADVEWYYLDYNLKHMPRPPRMLPTTATLVAPTAAADWFLHSVGIKESFNQFLRENSTSQITSETKNTLSSSRPLHHINFNGDWVFERSSTPPEVSLFAISTTMYKSASNGNKPTRATDLKTVLTAQAFKYVDPIQYLGSDATFPVNEEGQPLTGGRLRDHVTGQVSIIYQPYGTWGEDTYSEDDSVPLVASDEDRYHNAEMSTYVYQNRPHFVIAGDYVEHDVAKINDDPQSRGWAKKARLPELKFSSTLRESALRIEELNEEEGEKKSLNMTSNKAGSQSRDDGAYGPGSLLYVVLLSAWTMAIILGLP